MKSCVPLKGTVLSITILAAVFHAPAFAQEQKAAIAPQNIYHTGWIDFNKNGEKDVYEDASAPVEERIQDLLSQMSVEEKAAQCASLYGYKRVLKDELPTPAWDKEVWKHGIANIDEHLNGLKKTAYAFPFHKHVEALHLVQRWFIEQTRLGIPVDFTNEGIHGLNHSHATPLPSPLAIGSTWDKQLVHQAGLIVGREAKALGYTNVYAPILDIARDPRWGRVLECYGEDPYLVGELGVNMVNGIQSQGVASTLKHFAVYSVPKGGRDGAVRTDPHVSPRELHELHLHSFREVITRAHPMGVMSSYNDWDGVPVSGSSYFLTDLLRNQYGFKGYVVSDSDAVEFLHTKHRVAPTYKDAVRQVAEAGLNVRTNFTPPEGFVTPLIELVKEGKLSQAVLDRNVADVLRVKFNLGLFDQPYQAKPEEADRLVASADTEDFMMKMARESIILLKNQDKILPLDLNKTKKILVTGPLASDRSIYVSRYGPQELKVPNMLEAIQDYVGDKASVSFEKGCDVVDPGFPESEDIPLPLNEQEKADIAKAVQAAQSSDVIIAFVGEDERRVGESKTRTSLNLPGRQRDLLMALQQTGKPIIMVLLAGRPQSINWENKYLNGILCGWFPSIKGCQAMAETIFGDNNPSGKLSVTMPKSVGQVEWNFPFKPASQSYQQSSGPNGFGNTESKGCLYPFGYGLSYTDFKYSNLVVNSTTGRTQGKIDVSVQITNTGARAGEEVVQLYLRDKVASVITYDYVLRGFERIALQAGESKTVNFTLTPKDLQILDANMNWSVEEGEFEIMVGASSEDLKLKQSIYLKQ